MTADMLTLATLNTRGLPLRGTRIEERFAAIAAEFDAGDADVVCLQEVYTYRLLRLLRRGLPSFPYAAYRRSFSGPAGGLVVFSRQPVSGTTYRRLPGWSRGTIPLRSRLNALHCGVLAVQVAGCRVLTIHPAANIDGDWSEQNRFRPLQAAQFNALAAIVGGDPAIVCGDFNLPASSTLHAELLRRTGLRDAFQGDCPPTYHAEFLPAGRPAHCIDFVLVSPSISVRTRKLIFASGPPYVSDHLGLQVTTELPAGGPSR
ncbi:endonuclease/exonuclease/phosphatase family protein [Kribbella sp. NPDC051770]|uniref:endonuclease/exonuclease/phosphatase family protein n=1 Tax=Kribbella sp. NPDC051770 TaxID=3155413 RepID=UPI003448A9CD